MIIVIDGRPAVMFELPETLGLLPPWPGGPWQATWPAPSLLGRPAPAATASLYNYDITCVYICIYIYIYR